MLKLKRLDIKMIKEFEKRAYPNCKNILFENEEFYLIFMIKELSLTNGLEASLIKTFFDESGNVLNGKIFAGALYDYHNFKRGSDELYQRVVDDFNNFAICAVSKDK